MVECASADGTTQLTVWLMKQGIPLHWSGFRHPQTQGKVERFHGALERALQPRRTCEKNPAALAGRVSLGAQPCASARSLWDANSGQCWRKS